MRNKRLIYIEAALGALNFQGALWIVFLTSRHYSLVEVGLLQAAVNAGMVVMEIPSGAIADIVGRRPVIACARLLAAVYYLVLLLGGPFWLLAVGFAAFGVSWSLISGAELAILTEAAEKEATDADRATGRYFAILTGANALGLGLGGALQSLSWSAVFVAGIAGQILAFGAILLAEETTERRRLTTSGIRSQLVGSARHMREEAAVGPLIFALALFTGVGSYVYLFAQDLFDEAAVPLGAISALYALEALLSSGSAEVSHHIRGRLGTVSTIAVGFVLAAFLFVGIGAGVLVLLVVCFVLLGPVDNVVDAVGQGVLVESIAPEHRATVLSFLGFGASVVLLLLGPIVGLVAGSVGLGSAVILIGVTAMATAILLLLRFLPARRRFERNTASAPSEAQGEEAPGASNEESGVTSDGATRSPARQASP